MGKILRNGWVGLQLSVIECDYKELDRQFKEQFIHGLNDTDLLAEIIQELTIIHENTEITSENVLPWVKGVAEQRAQSTMMNSLTEAREFNKLKIVKNTCKDSTKGSIQTKMPTKHTCR